MLEATGSVPLGAEKNEPTDEKNPSSEEAVVAGVCVIPSGGKISDVVELFILLDAEEVVPLEVVVDATTTSGSTPLVGAGADTSDTE